MRRLGAAAVLLAVLAACSGATTTIEIDIPADIGTGDANTAAKIIEHRLDAVEVTEHRIEVNDSTMVVEVPADTPHFVVEMTVATGVISIRPVWGIFDTSPMIVDPDRRHPDGVDQDTGLTLHDQPFGESYLADQNNLVYHIGPAIVTSTEMPSAVATTTQAFGPDYWVVDPDFTPSGAAAFRQATKVAATYPSDDPRRQVAIVVDGVVFSAPAMSPYVTSTEGVDPDEMLITIGIEDQDELTARILATYLNFGALPFPVDIIEMGGTAR